LAGGDNLLAAPSDYKYTQADIDKLIQQHESELMAKDGSLLAQQREWDRKVSFIGIGCLGISSPVSSR